MNNIADGFFDEFINSKLSYITKLWCNITGKSNFALTYVTLYMSVLAFFWDFLYEQKFIYKGVGYLTIQLLLTIMWGNEIFKTFKRIKELEKHQNAEALPKKPIKDIIHNRSAFTFALLLFSFIDIVIVHKNLTELTFNLFVLIFIISCHFATHFDKGGRSVWQRIKEKNETSNLNLVPVRS